MSDILSIRLYKHLPTSKAERAREEGGVEYKYPRWDSNPQSPP